MQPMKLEVVGSTAASTKSLLGKPPTRKTLSVLMDFFWKRLKAESVSSTDSVSLREDTSRRFTRFERSNSKAA